MPLADGVKNGSSPHRGARGQPDGEVAGLAATGRLSGGERRVDGAQRGMRRLQQRLAGLRELDAAGGALQQRDAELLLEPRDRGAQRLLGDMDAPRGAGEVEGAAFSLSRLVA